MSRNSIDAALLKKMFLAGAKSLEAKKEWINELNVFPVPDGDTGTNMTLTVMSAARDVSAIEEPTMEELCKAISSGSLKGARGNSGVILSQLLRGFTRGIKDHTVLDQEVLSDSFKRAVETAYKAVMKPKEGTILTVARGAAEKAEELLDGEEIELSEFIDRIIEEADDVLQRTPDMLPVLKQAGVVDSGGQGLLEFLKGARNAFLGKEVDLSMAGGSSGTLQKISEETEEEIRFGYCTEYIIVLNRPLNDAQEREYKSFLESIGDSIVMVADEDIVKTHVHTNEPGVALTKALTYGSLSRIKIDNMREEHQEKLFKEAEKQAALKQEAEKQEAAPVEEKEIGFLAVSVGDGLEAVFTDLGVDRVLSGGQTMNPSAGDILEMAESIPAKNIFILPNNKNIILAAEQAAKLCESRKLIVIPTTTIPEGIGAMVSYVAEMSLEENVERMKEESALVKTVNVTYAVRDTELFGVSVKEGDYIAVDDKKILANGTDRDEVSIRSLDGLIDEESAVVSLYYGEDVTEEEASALAEQIEEANPDVEVEVTRGGQSIYYYIISVE